MSAQGSQGGCPILGGLVPVVGACRTLWGCHVGRDVVPGGGWYPIMSDPPPPEDRITDACKNITLAQLLLRTLSI